MPEDSDYKSALDNSIEDAKESINDMDTPDFQKLLEIEENGRDRETMKQFLESQWKSQLEDLNNLVDHFEEETDQALDIQQQKQKLEEKVKDLREKKADLEETVSDLKTAKNSLEQGLKQKEDEIEDLQSELKEEKDKEAELETEKHSLERKVDNLEEEKQTLKESLSRTEDLLLKFKHQVKEFDQELEA